MLACALGTIESGCLDFYLVSSSSLAGTDYLSILCFWVLICKVKITILSPLQMFVRIKWSPLHSRASYSASVPVSLCVFSPVFPACSQGKWQPAPVFLPGESRGQRSLTGCAPQGPRELDTTGWPSTHTSAYKAWHVAGLQFVE